MASRGRVSWEQVEVPAQGAAVLRHLLAAVELGAGGVAFTLLDERVHLGGTETHGPQAEHLVFSPSQHEGKATEMTKDMAREEEGGTRAHGAERRLPTFTSMSATCVSQALSENT